LTALLAGCWQRIAGVTLEHTYRAAQVDGRDDVKVLDHGCLARSIGREHERAHAGLVCGLGDRQGAVAGAQRAVQCEFPEQRVIGHPLLCDLVAGRKDRAGQREVEAWPRLGDVTRREVCGDAVRGKLVPRVEDRCAHAVARLAHRRVGKAHDREGGQPVADVHLHRYRPRLQSFDGERLCSRKHAYSRLAVSDGKAE
jgi:hypothetical protein